MNRLFLNFLALPTLVGGALCWLAAMPSGAFEQKVSVPDPNATEPQVCVMSRHSRFNLVCEKVSKLKDSPQVMPIDYATDPQDNPAEFKFSEEESNAAIALFGCDCPLCLNSLRTLRTMPQSAS